MDIATNAVQVMAGICFIFLGISFMWRVEDWIGWITNLQGKGRRGSLTIGMLALLFGSFIVAFHPVWQGVPLLLTLLGVLAIIKGVVLLLFPGWLPDKLERNAPHIKMIFKIKALLAVTLGAALLSHVHPYW